MENNRAPTKQEVLLQAIETRKQEIFYYQINIDNYSTALNVISKLQEDDKKDMESFKKHLETLLTTEKIEQKKAQVMLAALEQQMEK